MQQHAWMSRAHHLLTWAGGEAQTCRVREGHADGTEQCPTSMVGCCTPSSPGTTPTLPPTARPSCTPPALDGSGGNLAGVAGAVSRLAPEFASTPPQFCPR